VQALQQVGRGRGERAAGGYRRALHLLHGFGVPAVRREGLRSDGRETEALGGSTGCPTFVRDGLKPLSRLRLQQDWGVREVYQHSAALASGAFFFPNKAPPDLRLTHTAASGANASAYTFSTVAIGEATADRLVIVVVHDSEADASAGDPPSSVVIDGTNGTIHESGVGTGSNSSTCSIASRLVTVGTAITVVVNWPDAQVRCGISVYTLKGYLSATPVATNSAISTTASVSVTMDVTATQIGVIGVADAKDTTGIVWTNAIEQNDQPIETSDRMSSALLMPGSGNITRTATASAAGELAMAGAVWE